MLSGHELLALPVSTIVENNPPSGDSSHTQPSRKVKNLTVMRWTQNSINSDYGALVRGPETAAALNTAAYTSALPGPDAAITLEPQIYIPVQTFLDTVKVLADASALHLNCDSGTGRGTSADKCLYSAEDGIVRAYTDTCGQQAQRSEL